ncbi:HD-GYP domain-containing protein, partial [Candidatus Omnitrophota bacterium]
DDYTFVHCINTAILSMFQARILGLVDKEIVKIGAAAFLHDIGKIAIKRTLLDKKGALDSKEFLQIKNHVLHGAKILLKSPAIDKLSFIVNFQHHVGFNLKGYPKVKLLKKQNLASRIVSISDVYDALRSRRSYRESMSLERVYEIMKKEENRLFDSYLLELFFRNLGIWPAGTLVRLDTQEVGLVTKNNPQDIFRPQVEVYFDGQDNKLDESFEVDLTERQDNKEFKRRILRHLYPTGEGKKFITELFGEM